MCGACTDVQLRMYRLWLHLVSPCLHNTSNAISEVLNKLKDATGNVIESTNSSILATSIDRF